MLLYGFCIILGRIDRISQRFQEVNLIPDNDTARLLSMFSGRRVLVVGDLVLDHYLEGEVSRISPEAPVPVVSLGDSSERWLPGGAANVALNVLSLGGKPSIAGVVGSDAGGEKLLSLLSGSGVDVSGVAADTSRPTTVKTRIMGRNQQLMRVDREKTEDVSDETGEDLFARLEQVFPGADSVIIEDYNKGVLSRNVIHRVMGMAEAFSLPVSVDPKLNNFWEYRKSFIFKPNRYEAGAALGSVIETPEDAVSAAKLILEKLVCRAVLLTMGSRGSVLVDREAAASSHIPAVTRHVFDVSGAGDSVIAVMGLAACCSMSLYDAARLANLAAAAVCSQPGVYAVNPGDIVREAARFE